MFSIIVSMVLMRALVYYIGYVWSVFFPNELTTMVFSKFSGSVHNEIYEAAEIYLDEKIKDEDVFDFYDSMQFKWSMVCEDIPQIFSPCGYHSHYHQRPPARQQVGSFQLQFNKKDTNKVLRSYLPYVLDRAKSIREEKKTIKLFTIDSSGLCTSLGYTWSSIKFNHPSTFETLALDPKLKNTIVNDLDIFVQEKEFYKKVGKAWKRGYLIYGPLGTGKSSLVAAIANYLNFDIYYLDLNEPDCNSELRKLMVTTTNKSILVVEDLDLFQQDREKESKEKHDTEQITISGLLKFIDGLWSSCGDERLIIFTTNHKEKLDPAILSPGRIHMHINLSYCTFGGFKTFASKYLGIESHPLFDNIKNLIKNVEVTPAELVEKLRMKNRKPDVVIQYFFYHLRQLKIQQDEVQVEEKNDAASKNTLISM